MLNLCRRIVQPVALALLLISGFALRVGADTVNMQLTSAGNNVTDGVYVDPYMGTINGAPAVLYCDDFTHDSTVGETWPANATSYTQLAAEEPSGPWTVRFTSTSDGYSVLQNYEAAGWLVQQMAMVTAPNASQQYSDYSFALWAIFDPGTSPGQPQTLSGYLDGNAAKYYSEALAGISSYSLSEFTGMEIYTPTDPGPLSPQEFITTPEPSSLVLVGLGLLMIVAVIRLRITGPGLHPVG